MEFNDKDVARLWNIINPCFYGMVLDSLKEGTSIPFDGVAENKETFIRRARIYINYILKRG